ncbi:MAG TPA: redox-sensing transcriptional repressor Rex, partial [Gemmatimonadaceae bacterium]|nr:redox-sensing transcriptional repressor Rex [Gemmatimonadaceae bacterium]
LAQYHGFSQRGFRIVAVYDADPAKIGRLVDGLVIRPLADLPEETKRQQPDIAVLAVPAVAAQEVADLVVQSGIRAILNFAPHQLQVPDTVAVKAVNMAIELEGLSFALTNG